jgi:hypothetical protein
LRSVAIRLERMLEAVESNKGAIVACAVDL